ncbi:hypothetical protein M408DRAFT_197201 [Serendipita vermifera MAFF 305830]|uniref:Uncharacterized protein n=1 Tax=Serendipita vermifera MAFF 305830 TaxID=933852 RepID=A0A0C3B1X6_SERVB|nr:hypothetical protein M408DRAFT_197201 [Serendipita vermifera MAFF 305830]
MPYLIGFIQGRYYGSSAASSIAASALVSLGSCTEFHNIVSAAIISIIKEMDRHVNLAGIDALIKLAALQTFQGTIRAIIPILVKLMRSKLSFKDKMEVALALDKLDVYQPTLDPKKELYHWVKFLGEDH